MHLYAIMVNSFGLSFGSNSSRNLDAAHIVRCQNVRKLEALGVHVCVEDIGAVVATVAECERAVIFSLAGDDAIKSCGAQSNYVK